MTELDIEAHKLFVVAVEYLHCHICGKQVSTGYIPLRTETPDRGLIVRAFIQCPECIETASQNKRKGKNK